jgi:Arc/MetJ-type ribon-helix-helix transcriptional regulator
MGGTHAKMARAKLSTTVSPKTLEFLEEKVTSGQAASLAEAVDAAIQKVRQLENRQRLAAATARYFDQLEAHAAAQENALAHDLASAASAIDFDKEL